MSQVKQAARKESRSVAQISQDAFSAKVQTTTPRSKRQRRLAIERGIAEHSSFEKSVNYYYGKKGSKVSVWVYVYTAFIFSLALGSVAVFFLYDN